MGFLPSQGSSAGNTYSAIGIAFLRSCYRQILGPCREPPQLADRSDVCFQLHPHRIWQATKSYLERGDVFGLISHENSLLSGTECSRREKLTTSQCYLRDGVLGAVWRFACSFAVELCRDGAVLLCCPRGAASPSNALRAPLKRWILPFTDIHCRTYSH